MMMVIIMIILITTTFTRTSDEWKKCSYPFFLNL